MYFINSNKTKKQCNRKAYFPHTLKNSLVSCTLCVTLIVSQTATTALAKTNSSPKEEVVYCMLDSAGQVNGVYVVNSFSGGDITDYGNYTNLKNLTTTDEIICSDDTITFHSDAKKVYYQGDLDTKDIPWNIDISYQLDGKSMSAQEIAGKSGKLEIHISLTQNSNCDESFWKGYALQATLTLHSDLCSNIEAEGATIANVGADKQLSYIILPGKGKEITITADVNNFEMDAITINGTKLNLELELDEKELTDKIQDIQTAAKELNDGASDLDTGAKDIKKGAKSTYNGALSLQTGAENLNNGASTLNDGIETIQDALNTLNKQSDSLTNGSGEVLSALQTIQTSLESVSMDATQLKQLTAASKKIQKGITELVNGLQTMDSNIDTYYDTLDTSGIHDIEAYLQTHKQAIQSLNISSTQRKLYHAYTTSQDTGVLKELSELVKAQDAEALALYEQYTASGYDANVITQYISNAALLINMETLLQGDMAYIQGSDALIGGISATLDSKNGALMKGALSLQSNYKQFHSSITSMVTSLNSLTKNMTTLKKGIDTLVKNYKSLDTGIDDYTTAVAKIAKGYNSIYQGSLSLAEGTKSLYSGTKDMVDGTNELYLGTGSLKTGTKEMKDGTDEFYQESKDADTELTDTIEETIDNLTGKDVDVISFVSPKNENISSVLFVLKTPAIEIPQQEESDTTDTGKKSSLWDKFLDLFR